MARISDLTIKRLPQYLHYLQTLRESEITFVSSSQIARDLKLNSAQIRKDLAVTGSNGIPKLGHEIESLINSIERYLNWEITRDAVLVGVGNLGRALLGYDGFTKSGIQITAAFDSDPAIIGTTVYDIEVLPIEKIENLVKRLKIRIGIITTPAQFSQDIADKMVAGGILGIWNFSPLKLKVPAHIIVQDENLYSNLAILTQKLSSKKGALK